MYVCKCVAMRINTYEADCTFLALNASFWNTAARAPTIRLFDLPEQRRSCLFGNT